MKTKRILFIAMLLCSISFYAQNYTQNNIDKGVVINGVKWATRNVGEKGTFVPSRFSKYNIYAYKDALSACPDGWRLPTKEDFDSLLDEEKVSIEWTTLRGINGRKFTDKITGKSLFLPSPGNTYGDYYWTTTCDTINGSYVYCCKTGRPYRGDFRLYTPQHIRCVAK